MASAARKSLPDKALSLAKREAGNDMIPALSSGKREWNSVMDDAVRQSMERHGHAGKPWGYVYGGLRKMNLSPVLKDANEQLASMGEGPITKKQMSDRWESVLCDEAKECAAVRNLSRKDYEDLVKAIAEDVEPENNPPGSVSSLNPGGGGNKATVCGWNWTKVMEGFNRQRVQRGQPRLTKQKLRNFYYTCKDAVKRNYSYANEESLASWPLMVFCREQKGPGRADKEANKPSALSCGYDRQQQAGAAFCSVSDKRGKQTLETPRNGSAAPRSKNASIHRPTPRRPDRASGIAGISITPLATITNLPINRLGSATTVAATPCVTRGSSSFGFIQKASEVMVTPSPFYSYSTRKRQSLWSSELQDSAFAPMGGRAEEEQAERRHSKAQKTLRAAAAEAELGALPVFPLTLTPCGSARQNTTAAAVSASEAAAAAAPGTSSIPDSSSQPSDAPQPEPYYLNMVMAAAEFLKTVDAHCLPRAVREKVGIAVSHFCPPPLNFGISDDSSLGPSGCGDAPPVLSLSGAGTNNDTY